MFNPAARFEAVRFANGPPCLIVDDALLPVPDAVAAALADFFNLRVPRHFDARRLLHMHCSRTSAA